MLTDDGERFEETIVKFVQYAFGWELHKDGRNRAQRVINKYLDSNENFTAEVLASEQVRVILKY